MFGLQKLGWATETILKVALVSGMAIYLIQASLNMT